MLPRFYRSNAGFRKIHLRLKQYSCPHCQVTGTLILHEYLRGYDLKKINKRATRGHRIFCNNRNCQRGCGRTCSSAALNKANAIREKLIEMRLPKAAQCLGDGIEETLRYIHFPVEHWVKIRTNNPLERIMKEIRRRTNVVGAFPEGNSALMLAAGRLRYIAGTNWSVHRYLNMEHLRKLQLELAHAEN